MRSFFTIAFLATVAPTQPAAALAPTRAAQAPLRLHRVDPRTRAHTDKQLWAEQGCGQKYCCVNHTYDQGEVAQDLHQIENLAQLAEYRADVHKAVESAQCTSTACCVTGWLLGCGGGPFSCGLSLFAAGPFCCWSCCGPSKTRKSFAQSELYVNSHAVYELIRAKESRTADEDGVLHVGVFATLAVLGGLLVLAVIWYCAANAAKRQRFRPNKDMLVVDAEQPAHFYNPMLYEPARDAAEESEDGFANLASDLESEDGFGEEANLASANGQQVASCSANGQQVGFVTVSDAVYSKFVGAPHFSA